jgi:hypothetical protein
MVVRFGAGPDVHGGAGRERGDDSRHERDAREPSPSTLLACRAISLPRADSLHGAGDDLARLVRHRCEGQFRPIAVSRNRVVQLGLEARGEGIEVLFAVREDPFVGTHEPTRFARRRDASAR